MTPAHATQPFTSEERRALLDEFFAVKARIDATAAGADSDPADRARYAALRRTYRERLPNIALSRNPFDNELYRHSFDPYGLDGLWWDYRSPNRPLEMLRSPVVAFTGAVRVDEPVERMPFLCRPGPGAPFVVPRIITREGVRAVLWSLSVGVHTAYVIVYFADPVPMGLEPFNDWGTDYYQFESAPERLAWDQASEDAEDFDFDLEKYVASGQLQWIAPGDDSMTLKSGVAGCPYLDLEGSRLPQLVQDGERWYDEFPQKVEVADIAEEATPIPPIPPPPSTESVVAPVSPPPPPSTPPASSAAPKQPATPSTPTPSGATRMCNACGAALKPTSKFCPSCGQPIAASAPAAPSTPPPAANLCVHCGQPKRPGAKFCASCGKA